VLGKEHLYILILALGKQYPNTLIGKQGQFGLDVLESNGARRIG